MAEDRFKALVADKAVKEENDRNRQQRLIFHIFRNWFSIASWPITRGRILWHRNKGLRRKKKKT